MHDGQVHTDVELVRRLVADQFPQLAELPITPFASTGTVNAIYRIGPDLCARLPLVEEWGQDVEKESVWLPRLAPGLSLPIPEPVEKGRPADSYPFSWAVYRWIDGKPYDDDLVDDEQQAARDLAQFVTELRQVEPVADAPPAGRRPLAVLDVDTRVAIESSHDVIDRDAARVAWEQALEAPPWTGPGVWIHTDLLRPNLLVRDGKLCAVIDFGAVGVGDPAADVIAAWSVFGPDGRKTFREALDVDDGTWNRARGYALHQAALIIPYYRETNPGFVATAKRTVEEILTDVTG